MTIGTMEDDRLADQIVAAIAEPQTSEEKLDNIDRLIQRAYQLGQKDEEAKVLAAIERSKRSRGMN